MNEKEILKAERQRVSEIQQMVRTAKLEEAFGDDLIERGVSTDDARKAVFSKLAEEYARHETNLPPRIEFGQNDQDKKRQGLIDALACRIDHTVKLTADARIFQGRSLIGAVELYLGRRLGETDHALARRAMLTSDLPFILSSSAEKAAQNRYNLSPRSFEGFITRDTLRNYKQGSRVRPGDTGSLVERPENADYTTATFGEEQELVQLKDYGIIHSFSSKMIVNDDLKLLQKVASDGGLAAGRLENQLVYASLLSNPTMGDSKTLFHADHGNIGTAGAMSETTFDEAFRKMRTQTSVDGEDVLNIAPAFLICGPAQELAARKMLAQVQPTTSSDVNPYSGLMTLVVDANITGNQYFFASAPSVLPTVVLYHLEGQEAPRVESRVKWENDALELKIAHACAAAPLDWRGLVKNAGQS